MALFSRLKVLAASIIIASAAANGQNIASEQASGLNPLEWLGANSPWFAGPNIFGISNEVPEGCNVEQAVYVVRHGSRYPDNGAYNEWVSLHDKIQAADFTGSGSLAFLKSWKPVLKNPSAEISQESITGYKESHDLGNTLRIRYPLFYTAGNPFMVWSNLYQRVIQTARMFIQGYMGPFADTLGNVVTVNAKGGGLAVGNSLGPSDSCPTFKDTSGGDIPTTWDSIYLPPITARLNALLDGNLTLLDSDVNIFPYLCGFESQITGKLSLFCGVFTDDELKQYQYRQDLRYFYGLGPGAPLAKNIFLPFLNGVVDILRQGPGVQGTFANGTSYSVPPLMMAFANDGQINEFSAAVGVFDEQEDLPSDHIPEDRIYYSSRFVSMRGTITLERLNCAAGAGPSSRSGTGTGTRTESGSGSSSNSAVLTSAASSGSSAASSGFATITTPANPPSTSSTDVKGSNPTHKSEKPEKSEKIKTVTVTETNSGLAGCGATPTPTTNRNHHHRRRSVEGHNSTYIRIMLNDAVYPLPSCQDGPGRSCLLADYADYVAVKYTNAGNWADNCNVTDSAASRVVKGASFFTDLALPFLSNVTP